MASIIARARWVIFLVVIASWSVIFFNAASERNIDPFKSIVTRARIERFYREYAPDKIDEVPSIIEKNGDKIERLFKRLENKYKNPVHQLEFGSLVQATLITTWENVLNYIPSNYQNQIQLRFDQFQGLPLPQQLLTITSQAMLMLFSMQFIGIQISGKTTTFLILWILIFLTIFRPIPSLQDMTMENVQEVFDEVWSSLNTTYEKLWALTVLHSILLILRSSHERKLIILSFVILSLYLTNPSSSTSSSSSTTLMNSAMSSIVSSKDVKTSSQLMKTIPKGSLEIHDFGILSILTFSKALNHHWQTPVFAIGIAEHWFGFVEILSKQGGMTIKGVPIPAWAIPGFMFTLTWTISRLF